MGPGHVKSKRLDCLPYRCAYLHPEPDARTVHMLLMLGGERFLAWLE